nr:hypothetical protein [uncultured Peptostreptococcus sp.]
MIEIKNNKIKVIKRASYRYRNFRIFKAMIMLLEMCRTQKGNSRKNKVFYGCCRII